MKRFSGLLISLCVVLSLAVPQNIRGQASAAPRKWINAVLETKKLVMERADNGQIPFDSLNVDREFKELQHAFPNEMSAVMPYLRSNHKRFLSVMNGSPEEEFIAAVIKNFKSTTWFEARIKALKQEPDAKARVSGLLDLFFIAHEIRHLDEQLEWLNLSSIIVAIDDMKAVPAFNLEMANQKLEELKSLTRQGFGGIYANNPSSIAAAKRALLLKREILLSNSQLDFDRIMVSRYIIGASARTANPSALGTQPNNWSNQLSAPRSGFNAEIAELSNLRSEMQYRTIYKPAGGSSVPDLKLHWDADKVMFSKVDDTKHWQVFEVGINGDGLRKVIRIDRTGSRVCGCLLSAQQ
jgi:hypothetical protein